MHIGQYIPGDSLIHRLDPRVKIASTIALSILILRGGVPTAALVSTFLIVLVALSRLGITAVAKAFRPVLAFFALLFFVHLFFTEGTPIPPFPPWAVTPTYEGLYRGIITTWQFALLILSASLLTLATLPTELVSGIERLLRPLQRLGVPSHDLAMMVSIALRFVPTFLEEIDRIKTAQMARGASFGSGPVLRRALAALSLLLPLVLSAFRRADELVTAMEARGYRRGPRTYMRGLTMRRADYVAVMVMMGMICLHFVSV
ncbi:MAG: energy-coupling factor transporter transmembrane protein EcfT [Deltaproteobacteria bacterium]|nr:energy-coupling factor transporter transmembrane protein EcfT [Deltaproteobacteria bacterium]